MLLRQTILYLPAQLLGPLAQLAAIVLWTHWLGPRDFGMFTLALASQEAVYLLLLFFWSSYLLRFLSGADERVRRQLDTIETWVFLANCILQIVAQFVLLRSGGQGWPSPMLVTTLFLFTFTRSYCTHLSERAKVANAIGIYTLLQTLGPVGGLVIGWSWAHLTPPGPEQVLMSYAIAQTVALLIAVPYLHVRLRLAKPDLALLRHACVYGLPLAMSGLLAWVPANGIRFVIEHGMGIAAVGLFSVGWALGQRACAFAAMSVTAAAFPIAVRLETSGNRQEALQQLSLNGALLCAVLLPCAAGLILLSRPLSETLVSAQYAVITTQILPIATLAGLIKNLRSHFASQPFLLAEKSAWTLSIDVLETVLFVVGVAIGLHYAGLLGAAWGALAGVCVGAIVSFVVAVRRLSMPIPGTHLLRIVLATAVMSVALWMMPLSVGWLRLMLAVSGGGTVYMLMLALLYRGHLGDLRKKALRAFH